MLSCRGVWGSARTLLLVLQLAGTLGARIQKRKTSHAVVAAQQHFELNDEGRKGQRDAPTWINSPDSPLTPVETIFPLGKPQAQNMGNAEVFFEAFTVMTTAEMFDRTWFMTLVCSLNHGVPLAFTGSVLALTLHAAAAVCFGSMAAGLVPKLALELISALLFGAFALVYAMAAYQTEGDEDVFQTQRREAEEEVGEALTTKVERSSSLKGEKQAAAAQQPVWRSLVAVFVAIFVAEWGDRTQLAMIGLSASMPALPVFAGAFVALIVLCLSACLCARVMDGTRISERAVNILCAISFGVIAIVALLAAIHEAFVEYYAHST